MTMTSEYLLQQTTIREGLPLLTIARHGADNAFPVIVLHGLRSRKERVLRSLYEFARHGFRAISFDLPEHGERPGVPERDGALDKADSETIMRIVESGAADLAAVLDELAIDACAVHGISLGGIIACRALCAEPRLRIASIAMGSPDWLDLFTAGGNGPDHPAYEAVIRNSPLTVAPSVYPPRPVLFVHGALDTIVPAHGVRNADRVLTPAYAAFPDRFRTVIYPDIAHEYTEEMLAECVAWTERFAAE
jgi:pimeloyl-ACP methyl ester carboxylesterase